jgi:type I restriction enzyme R subunit
MAYLLKPLTVQQMTLQNRLVMPPMATAKSEADGRVSKAVLDYYDEKSGGGYLSLIIIEHSFIKPDGKYAKGIEDYLPNSQYEREEHQKAVVQDILENWVTLSQGSKFHSIFATSSISEAIQYYRHFKDKDSGLRVTALFDPNIDNNGTGIIKEDAIIEIVDDYNKRYGMEFRLSTYSSFKKDISYRLAHKEQYKSQLVLMKPNFASLCSSKLQMQ